MAKRSMASIASGEPLPIIPPSDDPETEKWRRDVINYLRRLTGLFTDDNLPGGGGGAASGDIDDLNFYFDSLDNSIDNDYVVCEESPFAFNIDSIHHRAGLNLNATFTLEINGVTRTGTGDSTPSTVQGVFTPTDGSISIGDSIALNIGIGGQGTLAIAFTFKRTRA